MLEDFDKNLEGLRDTGDTEGTRELQSNEVDYLRELQMPSDKWAEMSGAEQTEHLNMISARIEELNLPDGMDRQEIVKGLFCTEISEAYMQIEAPQDFMQIEQVSDTLASCDELQLQNWEQLEVGEKVEVLNDLEARIAAIEHRPPCPIRAEDKGPVTIADGKVWGLLGGYCPVGKDITINTRMLESNTPEALRETLDTLVHEGRHAYQEYNVNECEVHPRHSEVESWAEIIDGKWEYWGDTSDILGQRLYEQQSIEIDARNFAADVLDKFQTKLSA